VLARQPSSQSAGHRLGVNPRLILLGTGALVVVGVLAGLFPVRVRYTGASVAFNAGGILGGAMAPIIAQALAERGGTETVGYYLALAGIVSWLGLLMVRARMLRPEAG